MVQTISITDTARRKPDTLPAPLGLGERWTVIAILVITSGMLPTVIMDLMLGLPDVPKWPIYLFLYAIVGMMLVLRSQIVVPLLRHAVVPFGFSLLPLFSVMWSVSPGDTLTQSLTLIGTCLVAVLLGLAIPPWQALTIVATAAVINPLLDLASVAVLPSIGIHQDGPWVGTWKGLHEQKNALGALCSLSLMVLVTHRRGDDRPLRSWQAIGLGANVFMWIAARSTTSWLVGLLVIAVAMAPRRWQPRLAVVVPVGLFLLAVSALVMPEAVFSALETLPGLVGKDSTLSNRLPIWVLVQPYIDEAYWLGYGYIAFWSDGFLPRKLFQDTMYFVPTSAHSSFVELRLGFGVVGMVGLAFFLASYVWSMWCAFAAQKRRQVIDPVLPMALPFLLYWLFQSLTESIILNRNDLIWVMFVWLSIHVRVLAAGQDVPSTPNEAQTVFMRRASLRRISVAR